MGLRIRTNVAALKSQRQLSQTTREAETSMTRLASGYRINKAADDAAGLAISESIRADLRSMAQAKRNAADGISMIQVAEGGFNEISNILVRLRELAVQSASDTVGNLERSFSNREYVQLVDEIDRIAKVTEFNGIKLMQGAPKETDPKELTFHIGKGDGTVPNTDTISLNIEDIKVNTHEVLNLGKGSEIGPQDFRAEQSGELDPEDVFQRVQASQKLTVIDKALTRVSENRATLGSLQSRLNSTINNLSVSMENSASAKSRIKDVDFASETANLTQQRILGQAGVSVLSQANLIPELAISLLRT